MPQYMKNIFYNGDQSFFGILNKSEKNEVCKVKSKEMVEENGLF